MANRIPLIVDSSSQRVKELPSGDNLDLTGNDVSAVRNILPEANETYDLGSETLRWRDLYLSGNSINLGGLEISKTETGIQFSVGSATSSLPISDGLTYATLTGTEILTNKTLTSPSINGGAITNLSSITTTGHGTVGGDLIVTGNLTVNGETTTISTANLVVEDKNIILADGSSTDAAANGGGLTLKGATDKTLTWVATTERWTSNQVFEAPGYTGTLGVVINQFSSDGTLSGNSTTTVPTENAVKTYVDGRKDVSETLTGKTVNLFSNTLTGTLAEFNTALSDADFATLAGTETLTNKTLTSPIISSISNTGVLTLPTSTDTLVGRATTDTLTNKSINLTNNTLTGTVAEFNAALSDADFATLAGTETLTNKTLGAATIAGNLIPDTNEAYDLGSSTNRFRDLYLSGSSIFLGTTKIMVDSTTGDMMTNKDSAGGYPAESNAVMTTKAMAGLAGIPYAIALGG